jgi:hypothetical protein
MALTPGARRTGHEADKLPPLCSVVKNQYFYFHSPSTRLITLRETFLALLYALKVLEQIRMIFTDNASLAVHCMMSVIIG